jgi:hypothetical protein
LEWINYDESVVEVFERKVMKLIDNVHVHDQGSGLMYFVGVFDMDEMH